MYFFYLCKENFFLQMIILMTKLPVKILNNYQQHFQYEVLLQSHLFKVYNQLPNLFILLIQLFSE